MRVFGTPQDLVACIGQPVATSDWITVTQERIDQFAQATDDLQWIHVDAERAKAGPFGAPIAHGFLVLALIPRFLETAVQVDQVRMVVNYGLNKVRFLAPVRAQSRLRGHLKLLQCDPLAEGWQVVWEMSIECEGGTKPACVAEFLVRLYS